MKCLHCYRNHPHRDGMQCKCGYRFALDPKTDRVSDRRFVSYINRASCNGTYSFTENQLYTAARRKELTAPISGTTALVFVGLFAVCAILTVVLHPIFLLLSVVTLAMTILGVGYWIWFRHIKQLSASRFTGWLCKYARAHGPIKGMIRTAALSEPPPEADEPDIYDYGVERVLIVQRPILVDLLIANKIHVTNRAVIASGDGYPSYISGIVDKLVEDSPTLPVFLLHDSDAKGLQWLATQTERFQSPGRPVIDMGLNSETLKMIRKLGPLKLEKKQHLVPVDALPMAMLANGIALSMEKNVTMHELLIDETSVDTLASFG